MQTFARSPHLPYSPMITGVKRVQKDSNSSCMQQRPTRGLGKECMAMCERLRSEGVTRQIFPSERAWFCRATRFAIYTWNCLQSQPLIGIDGDMHLFTVRVLVRQRGIASEQRTWRCIEMVISPICRQQTCHIRQVPGIPEQGEYVNPSKLALSSYL